MTKKFILFVSISLFANEKLNIIAKDIKQTEKEISASGDVLIISPTYYIKSKNLYYNLDTKQIKLDGNVEFVKNNMILRSKSLNFYKNKDFSLSPFFTLDSKLWLTSEKISKKGDYYYLEDSILSSCNCNNPFWSIRFSSGYENTKSKFLHTFNTRIYIKDVPIFYTPYFGFPTNNKRRSGLLIPKVGYSKDEGFFYSQGIYFAPKPNWDLEIRPQSRGHRGYGLYSYYRLVDSPYSNLKLQFGEFKEKEEYLKRHNLDISKNKHYGADLDYLRTKVFNNDSLWISLHYMNDNGYKTLETDKKISFSNISTSNINYYYLKDSYYSGIYFKYFIDTSKDDNSDTLQELPKIQFHSFSKPIYKDIIYSYDILYTNYYREEGLNVNKLDLVVPFSKSFDFNFFTLSLKEQFSLSKINYNQDYENAIFSQNKHIISLYIDLIKKYQTNIHTINFGIDYTIPYNKNISGDIYKVTNDSSELSTWGISNINESIDLNFNQSLYYNNNQWFNHKLKQSFIKDEENNSFYKNNLEQDISFKFSNFSISNNSLYNHLDKKIIQTSTTAKIGNSNYFQLTHYKSWETIHSNKSNTETITYKANYNYKNYNISYEQNDDLIKHINNKQIVTFKINKKCWGLNLKFSNNLKVAPTTNTPAIREKIIYLTFEFKPIGKIEQSYKKE